MFLRWLYHLQELTQPLSHAAAFTETEGLEGELLWLVENAISPVSMSAAVSGTAPSHDEREAARGKTNAVKTHSSVGSCAHSYY